MNYAFMTFSCPQLTLDEAIEAAKRFGYTGIEPRIESGHRHGLEFDTPAKSRAEARRKAEDAGIALCCVATSCVYADLTKTQQMTANTLRAIDLASDIGAPVIRVFGGTIPEGIAHEDARNRVAEALRSVADHAEAHGVTVCMETHDSWCNPEDVVRVMQLVAHPAIAVNWDIMHPVRRGGSTMERAFAALKPWIRHVHFHDGTVEPDDLELRPIGQGGIDHKTAVRLLMKMGYHGYLSGEWINWSPYEEHLPRELATMKEYEQEKD